MEIVLKIKAVSDIWTGGINIGENNDFRNSGIIGSIRWWYEITVRALGGYACSPLIEEGSCPDSEGNRCPVCELFGCTGWSRKFKLRLENIDGTLVQESLKEGCKYNFRFIFTKTADPQEIWLLTNMMKKIVGPLGSIGGKMPNKPSEGTYSIIAGIANKQNRNHHKDFGLIKVETISGTNQSEFTRENIEEYIKIFVVKNANGMSKVNNSAWPTLNQLFSIKGNFSGDLYHRDDINKLIGVNPDNPSAVGNCLRGKLGEKSKDLFSFKKDRVWGYCQDDTDRINIRSKKQIR